MSARSTSILFRTLGSGEPRADPVAVGGIREAPLEGRQAVLGARILNVRQQLTALADQMQPASNEIPRRPHARGVNVGLRQQAATQEARDLVRVDRVILGLAAMDGFHRQGVAQDERDPLRGAEIREPIPREHALRRDDQIVSVRGNDLEERLRGRLHVAMHEHLAGRVQDADVHGLHVEIDSAIVPMLPVVESHSALLLRGYAHFPCAEPTQLVGAGGGLNKHQRFAADGVRRDHETPRLKRARWADQGTLSGGRR
jgi:hypothetical protein